MSAFTPVPFTRVRLQAGLLFERQRVNVTSTLPIQYEQCKSTGRIDAFKLDYKPGSGLPEPHKFWDSDIAKWIEAAAYKLAVEKDAALEQQVDDIVSLIESAQQPDGYVNIHFTVNAPGKRWTNLKDDHELYCAGHLIEGAVAYFEATGKRRLLDVLIRYVDHIRGVFGNGPDQLAGYDGHPEIELALIRLFHATGDKRHLDLASFFVDQRGRQPHFFDDEREKRDGKKQDGSDPYEYFQAHLPIREQKTAEGHSVRLGYLYAGVVDVAMETGDKKLLAACKAVFNNIVERRMYIHGGIGSSRHGERFTFDYDLPNEIAYAETCAAISLIFFAQRLLHADADGRFADVIERALLNGTLSGVSLDGKKFYYANYLASQPGFHKMQELYSPERQEWFGCACCPPNLARLLGAMGGYLFSTSDGKIRINQYAAAKTTVQLDERKVTVAMKTEYPWGEQISLSVDPDKLAEFSLLLRIPDWCRGEVVKVNGKLIRGLGPVKGFITVARTWSPGDHLELVLPMPVRRVWANPHVRQDAGRVALMRGPMLYCLEEVDNGRGLNAISLPRSARFTIKHEKRLLGGVTTIECKGQRQTTTDWTGELYRTIPPRLEPTSLKFVPYFAWANRKTGEMITWVREA